MSKTYNKPILSIEDQIQRLQDRGMNVIDNTTTRRYLTHVGYYRLSIYWKAFQKGDEAFEPGLSFEDITAHYEFDKKLKYYILQYIEVIENSFKTTCIREMGNLHGTFWHLESSLFYDYITPAVIIKSITDKSKSKHDTLLHYYANYSHPPYPPIWMIMNIASFGELAKIYNSLSVDNKKIIARQYTLPYQVLANRIYCFSQLRNVCAHFDRLWNRRMSGKLMILKGYEDIFLTQRDSLYGYLVALVIISKKIGSHIYGLIEKIDELLQEYNQIELARMGMPDNRKKLLESI